MWQCIKRGVEKKSLPHFPQKSPVNYDNSPSPTQLPPSSVIPPFVGAPFPGACLSHLPEFESAPYACWSTRKGMTHQTYNAGCYRRQSEGWGRKVPRIFGWRLFFVRPGEHRYTGNQAAAACVRWKIIKSGTRQRFFFSFELYCRSLSLIFVTCRWRFNI